jgi:levanase/fructan beta-fructosidase
MYKEKNRPQFHFTTRRGWINDPNGLVFHNGLYHLYYQHNPYEREWENMTWGHATSPDLVHWTEHDDVLFPDRLGTMYSGSAVFDEQNTSSFGTRESPPLVYAYTADRSDREVQCIAYSLDGGMTLKKYKGNPVIDSCDKWETHDTRDPRLFWYEPGKHWVMVLNERDGHSIYNSDNLRDWTYESHVTGFWECPDLFELPVDGNPGNTRWVMCGASNTYMIGTFDGKTFVPQGGKYRFCTGTIYAAQTISHAPN